MRACAWRPGRCSAAWRAWSLQGFDDDEMIYGGSLYLTGRTQAGPLTIGLGATSTDSWSLWIAVGRPIGNGTILERGIFR